MLIDNGYKLLSKEVRYVDEKDMGMFICKLRKENNMNANGISSTATCHR